MSDKYDVNNMLNVTEAMNDMKYSAWDFDDDNNVVFKEPPITLPRVHFFKTTKTEREKLNISTICVLPMILGCDYHSAKKLAESIKLNGCSDWRLPTIDEFAMIKDIILNRIGYNLDIGYQYSFWTSTENKYKGTVKIISSAYGADGIFDRAASFMGCVMIVR